MVSFFSSESFEESPEQLDTVIRTNSSPVQYSSSLESLDGYSYDFVNAMEILNLAEALDAAAETSHEQTPVLLDSEESDTEELVGSVGGEGIVTTSIPVERKEIAPTSCPIERVYLEDQQITVAQDTSSDLEYQSAIERGPSRVSVSSLVSRIPRVCYIVTRRALCFVLKVGKVSQSRISQATNDSVVPPLQRSFSIVTRHTSSTTTAGSLRERMLRSGVKSRPPIAFTNTSGAINQHAHPQRRPPSRTTLHSTRLTTATPDSLQSEVLSSQSDRNTFSHSGSIACGFLRPTKSSEAKVSPKTPTKSDKQRTVMAFTASDRPLWR